MKVENMKSPRTGNPVANQFVIEGTFKAKWYRLFQSYESPIALEYGRKVFLFPKYAYSVTTSKYRNEFLHTNTRGIEEGIKQGKYILVEHESPDTLLAHYYDEE
jgi:hypothetical protein